MILNIGGVIRTYKLRFVLLFESDFNFANNVYFGSRLMKISESLGVLPQGKYGGSSGHNLIERYSEVCYFTISNRQG